MQTFAVLNVIATHQQKAPCVMVHIQQTTRAIKYRRKYGLEGRIRTVMQKSEEITYNQTSRSIFIKNHTNEIISLKIKHIPILLNLHPIKNFNKELIL